MNNLVKILPYCLEKFPIFYIFNEFQIIKKYLVLILKTGIIPMTISPNVEFFSYPTNSSTDVLSTLIFTVTIENACVWISTTHSDLLHCKCSYYILFHFLVKHLAILWSDDSGLFTFEKVLGKSLFIVIIECYLYF